MQIFLSVWREFYRQKTSMFFTLLFPVLLVFILGTLLQQFNTVEQEIPNITICYISEQSNQGLENYFQTLTEKKMLTVIHENSLQDALIKLDDTCSAVVEYSAVNNKILVHQGKDNVSNRTLNVLLSSYTSMEQAAITAYQNGVEVNTNESSNQEKVQTKKLGIERSMIDYYAVSMIVMIFFMAGSIGSACCFRDYRTSGLQARTNLAPVNKMKVFFMMLLGNMPTAILELAAIMSCSVLFFGAKYAVGFTANLVFVIYFILLGLTVNSLGAIVGILVNADPTMVLMPISWVMLFFGGTFTNDVNLGTLTNVMPTHVIQQAVFDLTMFGNYGRIFSTGFVMIIILAVSCVTGAILFSRKRCI